MTFYPVYACPTHPTHEVRGFFGPPVPGWCGWLLLGDVWPCQERLAIVRWVHDPARPEPKAPKRTTATRLAAFLLGVLGCWAVIAFGAFCIYAATHAS